MRSLVTGACGFVGNYLVKHLLECGDEVLGTFWKDRPRHLRCETAQLDVTDAPRCREMIERYKPEVLYHLAGMAFVPDAERDFPTALAINVIGTYNVFHACHVAGFKTKVILVSSAQVYAPASADQLPLRENSEVHATDNYGLSKIMAEEVADRFSREPGSSVVIMRPFNHIGAGQRVDFAVSNFSYQLAEIAKGVRPPTMKVGNLAARRDFTDVHDIVRGYRLAALKGRGIYNLCTGTPISLQTILDTLIDISGLKVTVATESGRLRTGDKPDIYGSAERAQTELGWKPTIQLRRSLEDIYNWWLKSTSTER